MATLTIRNLPDDVRDRLRVRAARNGRSMEAEARALLAEGVGERRPKSAPAMTYEERVRRLQAAFRKYVPPGVSAVDELIADRRWEAACEEAAARGLPRPKRSAFGP